MKFFIITCFLFLTYISLSQCQNCPPVLSCSGRNDPVSNNQNINNGQTYWHTASNGNFNINFNGGRLIVLGHVNFYGERYIMQTSFST